MAVLRVLILIFTNFVLKIHASYHWVVTENGRIQSQMRSSGFPIRRSDDLMVLLEQEQRINSIIQINQKLVSFKRSIDNQWSKIEGEGDFEERLYSTDRDCVLGVKPLTQHDLRTEFVDYGQGSRPKMKSCITSSAPNCAEYSELDFSMMTFPHLETLNRREDNLTVTPTRENVDIDIDAMLKENRTDWAAYNVASLYWRAMGNGTNALECARRAIYFSPRDKRHIALLNLGTLLQELRSLGEAAIVLHSAVDHDPLQHVSHLALGNVYAALGDYTRSLACYENVLSLHPQHERALMLKHAIRCQEKLESGLLDIHARLENFLRDLEKYCEIKEKWELLQNQVNWEKDNKIKDYYSFSQPLYLNLRLLSNVEKQAKSLMGDVRRSVREKKPSKQSEVEVIQRGAGCPDGVCPGRRRTEEREEEETELEVFDGSEYSLRSEMNALIDLIKSLSYDEDFSLGELTRKLRQQMSFLRSLSAEAHFSADQTTFLSNFDSCLDNHRDLKGLNECLMRVLDVYSVNVSNRIAKLKERMKLMGQESKKNFLGDESSLENYIEVGPELAFESGSRQRFRDATEL